MTKKVTPTRKTVKELVKENAQNLKSGVFTLVEKVKAPKKPAKKLTKAQKAAVKAHRKNVIMGVGLLLAVVSISYSTSVVFTLVDTQISLIALAPQAIFAIIILYKAFSKIYQ